MADRLGSLVDRTGGEFWSAAVVLRLRERTDAELEWLQALRVKAAGS
ncbi:hypothetical protein [Humibacter ginsenosidimutans]|nr:hypothetical protein [Humibacter ginsenosidimutans]